MDHREDWIVRWIATRDGAATPAVLAARQRIDAEETQAKMTATLKSLEKQGYLESRKEGTSLYWEATDAGREAMA